MTSQLFSKEHHLKLRSTLILSFIIVISLTVCCITFSSYLMYKQSMVDQLSSSRLDLMAQISNNIKQIQDEIVTISDLYYHDHHLNEIATDSTIDKKKSQLYNSIMQSLDVYVRQTLSNYNFNYNVQLICNNEFIYTSSDTHSDILDSYSKQLWYVDLIDSEEELFWLSSLTIYGTSPTDTNYFSLIRKIKNNQSDTEAILIISVDERVLFNTYKDQLTDESFIYLVDQQGRIVSHPIETMVGRVFYDMQKLNTMFDNADNTFIKKLKEDYLFSRYIHPNYDWITIEEIPLVTIIKPIKKITIVILLIALIVTTFCVILSILIANSVSKPLSNVYMSMKKAQEGNFNVAFPNSGFHEARGISTACEGFVKNIVELHDDLRFKEKEKHKLELDFLQAQINPHFLYNTLFTIKCMVDMNYNAEACAMIDSLTGILKATLGTSGQYTTIQSEMVLLKQYSYILLRRYKGLFTVDFDVDPATHNYYILHFLIQPILENAIFHGFSNIKSGGHVLITSSIQEEQVAITVEDNGCGIEQDEIDKVFVESNNYDHIGLHNVYKRVKLHYNDTASMSIESHIGKGTTIKFLIPKVLEPTLEEERGTK